MTASGLGLGFEMKTLLRTCSELPLGKCIMTSEMVCRKVWNTAGRGYSPLLSTNRVHQYVTSRELPLGKCIMMSEMVCRKVWNTAGRGFTAILTLTKY